MKKIIIGTILIMLLIAPSVLGLGVVEQHKLSNGLNVVTFKYDSTIEDWGILYQQTCWEYSYAVSQGWVSLPYDNSHNPVHQVYSEETYYIYAIDDMIMVVIL